MVNSQSMTLPTPQRLLISSVMILLLIVAGCAHAADNCDMAANKDFKHCIKCCVSGVATSCSVVTDSAVCTASMTTTTTVAPKLPTNWPANWPPVPDVNTYFCSNNMDRFKYFVNPS